MKNYIDYLDDIFEIGGNETEDFFKNIIKEYSNQEKEKDLYLFCNYFFNQRLVKSYTLIREEAFAIRKKNELKLFLSLRNKQISLLISSLKTIFRVNFYMEEELEDVIENRESIIADSLNDSLANFYTKFHQLFHDYFERNVSYLTPKEYFNLLYEELFDDISNEIKKIDATLYEKLFVSGMKVENKFYAEYEETEEFIHKIDELVLGKNYTKEIENYYKYEIDKRVEYLKFIGSSFDEIYFIKEIYSTNQKEAKGFRARFIGLLQVDEDLELLTYIIDLPRRNILQAIEKLISHRLKIIAPNETIETIIKDKRVIIDSHYTWNKSIIDLSELINAFYLEKSVSKDGSLMEIKDYIELFENLFDIEIKSPYNKMKDARNRDVPNKFLKKLTDTYLRDVAEKLN